MSELLEHLYFSCNPWWEGHDFETGITREHYLKNFHHMAESGRIEILGGCRSSGKSTLLLQMVKRAIDEGFPAEQVFYLIFEHPRFSSVPITTHLEGYYTLFRENRGKRLLLIMDEVQQSTAWQGELEALYTHDSITTICAGSPLAFPGTLERTHEGRISVTTVHTLNFEEYLHFRESLEIERFCYPLQKLAKHYLFAGGYPFHVINFESDQRAKHFEEILDNDIMRVFQIQKPSFLRDIMHFISMAVGTRINYDRMARMLKMDVTEVRDYCSYLESASLIKSARRFPPPPGDEAHETRKFYLYDTGIKTLLTGYCDLGPLAENAVFTHLLRHDISPCYWVEGDSEVDFILVQGGEGSHLSALPVEVKYVDEFNWHDSLYKGLRLFLRRFPHTEEAIIVTRDCEEDFVHESPSSSFAAAPAIGARGRQAARKRRVAATSCTRRICVPAAAARAAAARLPSRRRPGSGSSSSAPRKDFRLAPTSSGTPRLWNSSRRRRIARLSSRRLPKPIPGSASSRSPAMPAACAAASLASSQR